MLFTPHIWLPKTAAAGLDPATINWVNAVVTNGGTVSAGRKTLVNNLIVNGKSLGWWTKMDRLWLTAAENEPSALTDFVVNALATKVGSPPFVVDRGYTGDGVSGPLNYIDTNYNPTINAVNFSQNAAHISSWSNDNNVATSGNDKLMGVDNDNISSGTNIGFSAAGTTARGRINDTPLSGSQGAVASRTGHWLVNRSGASTSQLYHNGSLFSSPNATSAALINGNFFILGYHDVFTVSTIDGSAHQQPMASIGGNLSATDVINFYNALRTYMTAVGVP